MKFAAVELDKRRFSFPENRERTSTTPQPVIQREIPEQSALENASSPPTLSSLSAAALPSVPETVERKLSLANLLRDAGKSTRYIKKKISTIVKENLIEFDFKDPNLCVSFVEGKFHQATKVILTPSGYLTVVLLLSNRILGFSFRKKYLTFMIDSAVFVRKLDALYRFKLESLERINRRLVQQNTQTETILQDTHELFTQTTNNTSLSFWSHMTILCKAGGYRAPTFGRNYRAWNSNAKLINQIRNTCSSEGRVRRFANKGAWLYVNDAAKDFATDLFTNTNFN